MNKIKSQSGSAHLIVIIVLIVALLGTLGFVVWQNFIQPKSNNVNTPTTTTTTTTTTTNTTDTVQLTKTASDQTRASGLAVKYPDNWVLVHTTGDSGSSAPLDISTIISPDGKVSITLEVGLGGIGGACDPDNTNDVLAFIDTASIPNYSNYSFASSVMHSVLGGVYHYQFGTAVSSQISSLVVGGSGCGLGLGVISTANGTGPTAALSVKFNDIENDQPTTLDAFRAITTTDDYRIAKQIIQSLYVK